MIVYQCDSCKKIERPNIDDGRPRNWIAIKIYGIVRVAIEYTLCADCAALPMTFGMLTVGER